MIGTYDKPGFIMGALKPFVEPAIWFEVYQDLAPATLPLARGGVDKDGRTIYDLKNDGDLVFEKALTHIFKKMGPTTLLNTDKIVKGSFGRLSPSAIKYDPMKEILALVFGVRLQTADAGKSFTYQIGGYAADRGDARSTFLRNSLNADKLTIDPNNIVKEFSKYQRNNYRIWSDVYNRIQALRTIGYTDKEIKKYLQGRRAFSKKEIFYLMKGRYFPANEPSTKELENTAFNRRVADINSELGTDYKVRDLVQPKTLREVKRTWRNMPLGMEEEKREEVSKEPISKRKEMIPPETQPIIPQPIQQPEPQTSVPTQEPSIAETTNFGQRFQLAGLTPSGLTRTEEAYLSPTEKLIAQRNRGIV
jgi:hypothetical protein